MSHWLETETRRMRPLLGTFVDVRARGLSKDAAARAIDEAFRQIAMVERRMSAHDARSDLGRLFHARGGTALTVHPWTYEVIEASHRLHVLSGGIFDVTIGANLERHSFLPAWGRKAGERISGTMARIELLGDNRIRLRRPMRLDLGGIAKGFAVDRAIDALMAAGASGGLVNAGGDFRIFDAAAEPLFVRDPAAPQRILRVGTIQIGAVATSSGYFRHRWKDSQLLAPYIDGRTGKIVNLRNSITVIAASCMWADALTKVLALDWQTGAALLDRFDAKALLLRENGRASDPIVFPPAQGCDLGIHTGT